MSRIFQPTTEQVLQLAEYLLAMYGISLKEEVEIMTTLVEKDLLLHVSRAGVSTNLKGVG